MKGRFRYSLENFRGVAIIFVMLSHISSIYSFEKGGDYLFYLLTNATAWFVFISGYLFYYLESEKFEYGKYLIKKLKYVVLPYLFLSVPAIIAGLYFSRHVLYGLTSDQYVAWSLVTGGTVVPPMWFIPMIVIFFLLTPVFNFLSKTKIIYIFVVCGLVLSIFSSRSVNNTNAFFSFLNFAGFYFLGMVAAKNVAVLDSLSYAWKSKIIYGSVAIFLLFGFLYPGIEEEPVGFLSSLGSLNFLNVGKLAFLVAIFFIFERYLERKNNVLGYLAKISFGLFFIHGFMILIFARIARDVDFGNAYVRFFSEVAIVVFVSIAVVFLIKVVLGKRSRYVVGC